MEVKVISVKIFREEKIISNSDYKCFRSLIEQGYHVHSRENGQCVLRKKAQILVNFECEGGEIKECNMRRMLSAYYRIYNTEKLVKRFKKELEKGKITLSMQDSGQYEIIRK